MQRVLCMGVPAPLSFVLCVFKPLFLYICLVSILIYLNTVNWPPLNRLRLNSSAICGQVVDSFLVRLKLPGFKTDSESRNVNYYFK